MNIAIEIARAVLNGVYRARCIEERANEVVFCSRQTDEPSYDFQQFAAEMDARGWQTSMLCQKVRMSNLPAYALHVWREIELLGRCKLAVVDRYDPVISLIDFENDMTALDAGAGSGASAGGGTAQQPANTSFPARPVVLQLWHAFGAFKKFGFQSNDTPEGHTSQFMRDWRIHRNNSWVVCSGEACRNAYAEAFSCPPQRVVALDRPERDELAVLRQQREQAQAEGALPARKPRILMAPTLRINNSSAHPFKDLYLVRDTLADVVDAQITWAFHPLDSGLPAPGNVSQELLQADLLVTDYSSIAFEAFLLGIPVMFYVPDLDDYVQSPGLNTNPALTSPQLCFTDAEEFAVALARFAHFPHTYPADQLAAFGAQAFDEPPAHNTAVQRLADFAEHACNPASIPAHAKRPGHAPLPAHAPAPEPCNTARGTTL